MFLLRKILLGLARQFVAHAQAPAENAPEPQETQQDHDHTYLAGAALGLFTLTLIYSMIEKAQHERRTAVENEQITWNYHQGVAAFGNPQDAANSAAILSSMAKKRKM